jgi:hypothetical protein
MLPGWACFMQPEIKFDSRRVVPLGSSFTTIVSAVVKARKANPFHAEKHKWALDFDSVANEVDAFIAAGAASMPGNSRFVADPGGSAPIPFHQPLSQQRQSELAAAGAKAKKLWAGIKTINDWVDSGEPAVAQEEAERRAAICVACPLNGQGGLEKFFTVPAAEAIRRQFSKMEGRKLATSQDDKLGICEACFCPMKLKVFSPMSFVKAHLTEAVIKDLRGGNNCWVVAGL